MAQAGWGDSCPRRLWAVVAAALSLLLAACGAGGGSSASTTPRAGSTGTATGADGLSGSNANGSVTNYLTYVGGTAGKADSSLSPLAIGWVNGQGGAVSTPQATEGAQAAVNFINNHLGGIGGDPP